MCLCGHPCWLSFSVTGSCSFAHVCLVTTKWGIYDTTVCSWHQHSGFFPVCLLLVSLPVSSFITITFIVYSCCFCCYVIVYVFIDIDFIIRVVFARSVRPCHHFVLFPRAIISFYSPVPSFRSIRPCHHFVVFARVIISLYSLVPSFRSVRPCHHFVIFARAIISFYSPLPSFRDMCPCHQPFRCIPPCHHFVLFARTIISLPSFCSIIRPWHHFVLGMVDFDWKKHAYSPPKRVKSEPGEYQSQSAKVTQTSSASKDDTPMIFDVELGKLVPLEWLSCYNISHDYNIVHAFCIYLHN